MAFLLAGLMGAKGTKSTVNEVLTAVQSSFTQSVVNFNTSCQATANFSQMANISNTGTQDNKDVLMACLNKGSSPQTCQAFMAQQNVSNVKQTSSITLSTNCSISNAQNQQIQNAMTAALTSNNNNKSDGFTDALNTFASGITGGKKTSANYQQNVTNMIQQVFTTNVSNSVAQAIAASQSLNISNSGLAVQNVSGLTLDSQTNAMMSVLMENKTVAAAVTAAQAASSTTNNNTSQGLTDIFSGIAGAVSGIFKSLTSSWIALLAVCAIIGVAVIWAGSKFLESDAGQQLATKAGNKAIAKYE